MASTGPPSGGLVALAANQKLYHLTSKRDFKLDPRKAPQNNTTLGGDFGPGIYLGPSVEYWCNGYGYWRPWVVEIVAPADIRDREGTLGGYGSEVFVPAKYYNELQIVRVIPLDAWCREEYGTYGWTEGYFETTFDTNEPIVLPPSERLPGPYRYPGDARNADATWASEYAKRVKRFARTRTNAIASKTSAGTDPTSGAFQDRLGRCYEIAGRYARENKGSFLVHGSIGHPGSRLKREPDQPPIGHAWAVDADGEVFEPISGKHFSWDAYRDLFGAVEWIRYPSDDVPLLMLKHRNWGPWDAEYIEANNIWHSNFMRWKDRQKTSAVASANDPRPRKPKGPRSKYAAGRWDKDGEDPVWVQDHHELVTDAIRSWKGSPSTVVNPQDDYSSVPASGSEKIRYAQVNALKEECRKSQCKAPKLYRGDTNRPFELKNALLGWTSSRKEAERWAKHYGGQVWELPAGVGVGIRISDYISDSMEWEREWILDMDATRSAASRVTSAVASANDVFYHGDSTAAPYGVGDTLTHSEKHEVWFTNNLRDARAYANRAVKRIGGEPIVYEVEVLSSTQRPPFKNPSGVQYCVGDVVLRGVVDTVATWSQTVASVRQGQGIPYLISEEDGVRVGDLEYYLDDDEEWGPIVKILNITVEPNYQHQGVARQMVQALERLFPDRYVAHGGFHSTAGESFAWSFKGNPRHLIENRDGDLRKLAVTAPQVRMQSQRMHNEVLDTLPTAR